MTPPPPRRAAVLGQPIAHSLSPVIHNAGYAAAGLSNWSYDAYECADSELLGFVAGLGPEWAGLSLTMPLKEVALRVADSNSDRAAALGAAVIERHITLNRAMWGSDQAASLEPQGLNRLVRDIRTIEMAMGDGEKRVYESEIPIRAKLRLQR